MGILDKLQDYKYHVIATLVVSSTLVFLVFVAPSFLTILAYFWPLLLSTALFLLAVVLFGKTPLEGADSSVDKAGGEGLIDYVAGQPDQPVGRPNSSE